MVPRQSGATQSGWGSRWTKPVPPPRPLGSGCLLPPLALTPALGRAPQKLSAVSVVDELPPLGHRLAERFLLLLGHSWQSPKCEREMGRRERLLPGHPSGDGGDPLPNESGSSEPLRNYPSGARRESRRQERKEGLGQSHALNCSPRAASPHPDRDVNSWRSQSLPASSGSSDQPECHLLEERKAVEGKSYSAPGRILKGEARKGRRDGELLTAFLGFSSHPGIGGGGGRGGLSACGGSQCSRGYKFQGTKLKARRRRHRSALYHTCKPYMA